MNVLKRKAKVDIETYFKKPKVPRRIVMENQTIYTCKRDAVERRGSHNNFTFGIDTPIKYGFINVTSIEELMTDYSYIDFGVYDICWTDKPCQFYMHITASWRSTGYDTKLAKRSLDFIK